MIACTHAIVLDSSAVEHPAVNRRVVGSNPTRGAFRGIVQSVERWSPKPNVEGSSPSVPVADTEKQKCFSVFFICYSLLIICIQILIMLA